MAVVAALLAVAGAGLTVPGEADASVSTNLVDDPNFVHGTRAWSSPSGTLSVAAGHSGHRAVRVTNPGSHTMTLALNDVDNTVTRTTAGARYTASAWVRSDAPGVSVATRESEWKGGASKGDKLSSAWLRDSSWHHVKVTYSAASDGASIDFNVLGWDVPAGRSVLVSQPSLTKASTTPAPSGGGAPSGYKLVFSDGFTGHAVNHSKWRVHDKSWSSNEKGMQTSRRKNVFVSHGHLTIRALREKYTAYGTTRKYTTGYLDTIGKHSWKYGRFVVRAKLPSTVGSWPAFWLRADHGLGEVDIMEAVGGKKSFVAQTLHQSTNGNRARLTHGVYKLKGKNSTSAWHTYGVTVTPTVVTWDIDGAKVFTAKASKAPWIKPTFADTLNIRLNLQVSGSMPESFHLPVTSRSRFPADYVIDYVRVYQRR